MGLISGGPWATVEGSLAAQQRPQRVTLADAPARFSWHLFLSSSVKCLFLCSVQEPPKRSFQKYSPPECWHGYPCSLSNYVILEKVEGRKTPISYQGSHLAQTRFNCQQTLRDSFQPEQSSADRKHDFRRVPGERRGRSPEKQLYASKELQNLKNSLHIITYLYTFKYLYI